MGSMCSSIAQKLDGDTVSSEGTPLADGDSDESVEFATDDFDDLETADMDNDASAWNDDEQDIDDFDDGDDFG